MLLYDSGKRDKLPQQRGLHPHIIHRRRKYAVFFSCPGHALQGGGHQFSPGTLILVSAVVGPILRVSVAMPQLRNCCALAMEITRGVEGVTKRFNFSVNKEQWCRTTVVEPRDETLLVGPISLQPVYLVIYFVRRHEISLGGQDGVRFLRLRHSKKPTHNKYSGS
ncbi:hypothetical protein J6590_093442 [Homalodisca vitripennis]|nr:hypothetical protein J6590_093442 [Homalodisca vitripennis]